MAPPKRPRLHPWIPLLGRDDGRLMLARGPAAHPGFTAADSAAVLAAARAADGCRSWTELNADPMVARGLALLWRHRALVDCDDVVRRGDDPEEHMLLVRAGLSHPGGPERAAEEVERRRAMRVHVKGPPALVAAVHAALAAAGLSGRSRSHHGQRVDVAIGRPSWTRIRRWMVDGVPHLVISPRTDSIRVGPLVVPGRTSCLQCLHLVRRDRHPDWPWLWEQLLRAPVPEPDPALMQHAAALAARCLVAYAQRGQAPDHYLELALDDLAATPTHVARHPLCGCWWPRPPVDG